MGTRATNVRYTHPVLLYTRENFETPKKKKQSLVNCKSKSRKPHVTTTQYMYTRVSRESEIRALENEHSPSTLSTLQVFAIQ